MKHIVVDLEMNFVNKKYNLAKTCRMETIEIGAVMLDDSLQEISSFRTYIKPEYNDVINRKISELTGITDSMIVSAPKFKEAFKMFTNWCLGTGDEITVYAWSETDYNQIIKEIELKSYEVSTDEQKICCERWTDFQEKFGGHFGFEKQLSLKNALNMSGIDFIGREHDALDDARNTAELLQIFMDKELFEKTLKKIEEVMIPKTLGSTLGDLFNFSSLVTT